MSLLTGCCLLLDESSAESSGMSHYFHAAISNHLSEKPKMCIVLKWSLNTGLTVSALSAHSFFINRQLVFLHEQKISISCLTSMVNS